MNRSLAHDIEDTRIERTDDIKIKENVDFKGLLLPQHIMEGLQNANFRRPSPIQLSAIPIARCGLDFVVQAKSGTGKTLVIAVSALSAVKVDKKATQVVILAPTREIAIQIKDVLTAVSSGVPGLNIGVFIGGLSIKSDKIIASNCHVAVGTPGRMNQLIKQMKILKVDKTSVVVLDEADKLMEDAFRNDISCIMDMLPTIRQTVLCSATFPESLQVFVQKYMVSPMWVTPERAARFEYQDNEDIIRPETSSVLLGVRQFIKVVPDQSNSINSLKMKLKKIIIPLLSSVSFTQCLIFSNFQSRGDSLCHLLCAEGWPAVSISGLATQQKRMELIEEFREGRSRILISTDLTSRGLDFKNVNLVVNLEVPYTSSTYLHRIGRSGRFGSYAVAVSLVSSEKEKDEFHNLIKEIDGAVVYSLPEDLSLIYGEGSNLTEFCFTENDSNHFEYELACNTGTNLVISKDVKNDEKNGKPQKQKVNKQNRSRESRISDTAKKMVDMFQNLKLSDSVSLKSYDDLEALFQNFSSDSGISNVRNHVNPNSFPEWRKTAVKLLASLNSTQEVLDNESVSSVNPESQYSSENESVLDLNENDTITKPNEDSLWTWDPQTKLYYIFHENEYYYELFDPFLSNYYMWYPNLNHYYCYDSDVNIWRSWDPETKSFISNKDIENYSKGSEHVSEKDISPSEISVKYDINMNRTSNTGGCNNGIYLDWIHSWKRQLRQMRTYIEVNEYMNGLLENQRRL